MNDNENSNCNYFEILTCSRTPSSRKAVIYFSLLFGLITGVTLIGSIILVSIYKADISINSIILLFVILGTTFSIFLGLGLVSCFKERHQGYHSIE